MSESPWLSDAAKGATGQTYEIRTVADFMKVPESRRYVCLREFHSWLSIQVSIVELFMAVADGMGTPLPSDAIQMQEPDVFRWHDDGKATVSVHLNAEPLSAHRGADHP